MTPQLPSIDRLDQSSQVKPGMIEVEPAKAPVKEANQLLLHSPVVLSNPRGSLPQRTTPVNRSDLGSL